MAPLGGFLPAAVSSRLQAFFAVGCSRDGSDFGHSCAQRLLRQQCAAGMLARCAQTLTASVVVRRIWGKLTQRGALGHQDMGCCVEQLWILQLPVSGRWLQSARRTA
jgi:hypothetical protein